MDRVERNCGRCEFLGCLSSGEPCNKCIYSHYNGGEYHPNFRLKKQIHPGVKKNNSICDKAKRTAILTEANNIVSGNRKAGEYGQPEDSFGVIAGLWSEYLDQKIKPHDVAVMMALLKIARIKGWGYKLDNWIDLAGYAACGGECQAKEEGF